MSRISGFLLLVVGAVLLTGCQRGFDPRFGNGEEYLGGFRGNQQNAGRAPHDDISYWDGDAASGPPSIRIVLGEQRAYFYKGGELVGVSTISTGREGFATPTGSYKILQKSRDHVSSLYGNYVDAQGN